MTWSTSKLLFAVVAVFVAAGNAAASKCNADNCYRAMFPCASSAALATASAFCATISPAGTTASNYPTRATAACGTKADRYISACACGPTCTPTAAPCTPYGVLLTNGDFECGLLPWTVQVPDPSAQTSVSAPGHTGSKAFEVRMPRAPEHTEFGVSARITQQVRAAANVPALLRFSTFFDGPNAGMIGVMVEGRPIWTVDANDNGGPGMWNENEVNYTPSSDLVAVTFEFLFNGPNALHRIDSIQFNYLH